MFSTIWSSSDASETLFLIAAIAFALEAVLILLKPAAATKYLGLLAAVGLTLLALGLLAA